MSEVQVTTIGGRELLPHEIAYVDKMAELLAKESGIDGDWLKQTLTKTFPDGGIRIHPSTPIFKGPKGTATTFISGKFPGRFLYDFKPCLLEAMKWFDKDYVVELFSGDLRQLKILEERYNSLVSEVPFVSFRDLLPAAKEFKNYLEEEFKTIIETGSTSPQRRFVSSYYLETTFLQSFLYRRRIFEAIPKEVYLEKHKQFPDGVLSGGFLEELLGPEYYREYGEIITVPDFLDPKNRDLKNRLKENLQGLISKVQTSLSPLERYLEANKLKVPVNLKKRDELLRTSLHKFSQDALNVFIMAHLNHEQGTILKKIWELICSMPYEQLDLIFNGNLSYLGIVEYNITDPNLYTYGRERIEKILVAAAIEDQTIHSNAVAKVRDDLKDLIADFIDPKTGELHPITYSVFQAIDLCGYGYVMSACGGLAKAKEELNNLKTNLQKNTKRALEISYQQLIELRRNLAELGGKKPKKAGEVGFSELHDEYKSRNAKYGTFRFTSPKMRTAMQILDDAYERANPAVGVTELITQLYGNDPKSEKKDSKGRVKERSRNEVLSNKGSWRLERDIFGADDEVVKYQMIQVAPYKVNDEKAYLLDFRFEERDRDEFDREIKKKQDERKQAREEKKSIKDPNKKTKTAEEKLAEKKQHPWNRQGRRQKKDLNKVYENKGGTLYEGEEDDDDE